MEYYSIEAWDMRVTLDLFLGGIAVGAYLLSVLVSFYNSEKHQLAIKIGAYSAPILVSLGLLLLISKIGVPSRFITTLWNVNPQSVMSVGVFLQTGFIVLSCVYAILIWRKEPFGTKLRLWQAAGTLFAFSVGIYHGLFLSSLGRVLWTELTSGMFLASSIASGFAFVLLLEKIVQPNNEIFTDAEDSEIESNLPLGLHRYRVLLFTVLMVQLISVVLWQYYTGRLDLEQAVLYDNFMKHYGILWLVSVLLGGTLIPMVISLVSLVKHESSFSYKGAIVTCLLILLGGFMMKHLMIVGGQVAVPIGFLF